MIITQKNGKHWNWQMIDRNVREKQRNERSRKIIGMVCLDNFLRDTQRNLKISMYFREKTKDRLQFPKPNLFLWT